MWTAAFLGTSTALVEATLVPIYMGKSHERFAGFVVRFVTIACILILQKPALTALHDQEQQRKAGTRDPSFDPETPGIGHADFWSEPLREQCEEAGKA